MLRDPESEVPNQTGVLDRCEFPKAAFGEAPDDLRRIVGPKVLQDRHRKLKDLEHLGDPQATAVMYSWAMVYVNASRDATPR